MVARAWRSVSVPVPVGQCWVPVSSSAAASVTRRDAGQMLFLVPRIAVIAADRAITISGITLKSNHNTFTFSHKTFQEYMQSELLLRAYKKDNIKLTITILNQNLASEIPYYFFYKTKDINEIFEIYYYLVS